MSLDLSLIVESPVKKRTTGVFIRENGKTRELTPDEVLDRFPEAEEVSYREYETNIVFDANITHNLNKMAGEAGLYVAIWRPEEIDCVKAKDVVEILENGLKRLKYNPDKYKKLEPSNGWGTYDQFVQFVEDYLDVCKQFPDAIIEVDR